MKKTICLLLILSLNIYAVDEDGSGGTPSSSATTTADEESNSDRPYIVVINGNTIMHCYTNNSCIIIEN